jgi:hypothetical protein
MTFRNLCLSSLIVVGSALSFAAMAQFSSPQRWNGTLSSNYDDEARACTIDHHGNVIVVGRSRTGPISTSSAYWRFSTVKYSATGTLLWQSFYSGPTGDDSTATAVAVDADDNVYVAGIVTDGTPGVPPTGIHFAAICYTPDTGSPVWTGTGSHSSYAFANGGVYITPSAGLDGYDDPSFAGPDPTRCAMSLRPNSKTGDFALAITGPTLDTSRHWRTVVFESDSTDGVRLKSGWPYDQFGAIATDSDSSYGVALGDDNTVYVVGAHHDSLGSEQFTAVRYAATGGNASDPTIWQYDLTGGGKPNKALSVALDYSGNAFVAGFIGDGIGGVEYATQKILKDADVFGAPQTPWGAPAAYDAGTDNKATSISLSFEKVSTAMQTYVYVAGVSDSSIATVRYKDNGTSYSTEWSDTTAGDSFITGVQTLVPRTPHIEAIGRGNAYLIGRSSSNSGDYSLVIYDKTGAKRDSTPVNYDNGSEDEGRWNALGGAGLVFYTGFSHASATGNDFLTNSHFENNVTAYNPSTISVISGTGSGTTSDLQSSGDGHAYQLSSTSGGSAEWGQTISVSATNPSEFTLRYRDSASSTGVRRQIYIEDRVHSSLELLSDTTVSTAPEDIIMVIKDDPAKYRGTNGNVKIHVIYTSASTFSVGIDLVRLDALAA